MSDWVNGKLGIKSGLELIGLDLRILLDFVVFLNVVNL